MLADDKLYFAFIGLTALVGPALTSSYLFWMIGQWLVSRNRASWSATLRTIAVVTTVVHGYALVFLHDRVDATRFLLQSWAAGFSLAMAWSVFHWFEDRRHAKILKRLTKSD
ncbi:MAG: hypothetical protein L0387_36955 [Acidobacteria bacterium]|nr:hypothetical protein [Acidobacteriota bacterium]